MASPARGGSGRGERAFLGMGRWFGGWKLARGVGNAFGHGGATRLVRYVDSVAKKTAHHVKFRNEEDSKSQLTMVSEYLSIARPNIPALKASLSPLAALLVHLSPSSSATVSTWVLMSHHSAPTRRSLHSTTTTRNRLSSVRIRGDARTKEPGFCACVAALFF